MQPGKEYTLAELVDATERLPPEELAAFIGHESNRIPDMASVQDAFQAYPPERQRVIAEKLLAAVDFVQERAREQGRTIACDLVNRALKGELSGEQVFAKLESLPAQVRIEAESVLSMVFKTNEALGRITSGEATIEFELPPDENGHYDRRCPAAYCGRQFKILYNDWVAKNFENVTCPICRHRAWHQDFDTPTQRDHVRHRGKKLIERELSTSLPDVEMTVRPLDYDDIPNDVAVQIDRALAQRLECKECQCHYSVIGASFYCPACGSSDPVSAFSTALATTKHMTESLPHICELILSKTSEDAAENFRRKSCETGLCDIVSAFERHARALFDKVPNRAHFKPRSSIFQNLPDSSDLWQKAIGKRYEDILDPVEWTTIRRLFQQRHVLVHNGGIIDHGYIDKTNDTDYALGQRLVVNIDSVLELVRLVEKVGRDLESTLGI